MADHMTAMTAEQLRAELGAAAEQWKREAADAERSNDSDVWMLCLRAAGQLAEVSARLSCMAADTWQPIETAPRDGKPIDVWRKDWRERRCNVYYVEISPDNWFFSTAPGHSGPTCIRDATHWMPKPAAPEPPHV